MKTRNGFVSNSSSSSFIIRGCMIKCKKIKDLIGKDLCEDAGPYDFESAFEDIASNKKLDIRIFNSSNEEMPDDSEDVLVGIDVYQESPGGYTVIDKELAKLNEDLDDKIITEINKVGLKPTKLHTYALYVGC